jgi:peptidyl-prolyl cis-trans isomerase SurA
LLLERPAVDGRVQRITLEPRLLYLWTPYRDQDDLPVFDTRVPDLNFVQLFRGERYVGADRVSDANQVSLGVTSRFYDGASGRQLLAATIGQTLHFEAPRVSLPNEPRSGSKSDLVAQLAVTRWQNFNVNLGVQWNPAQSRSERRQVRIQYRPQGDRALNLAYRFQDQRLEQTELSGAWPITRRWSAFGRLVYDQQERSTLEQFGGIEYGACCWRLRLQPHRRAGQRDLPAAGTQRSRQCRKFRRHFPRGGNSGILGGRRKPLTFNIFQGSRMISSRPRTVTTLVLLALLTGSAGHEASAQSRSLSDRGVMLDRVAAVVNEGVVLSSEVDEQIALVSERLKTQGLEMPPETVLRQQVLERLVLQEIQMQRAQRAGIRINDENLNQALGEVAQRNGIPLAQLPEALTQQGLDYASYRESVRREMTLQVLQQRDVIQRINVSPRELDQFLEKQKNRPSELNEYNLSHILIAVPQEGTPQQLDEASRRAADVGQRARSGEDFAKLAVAYSNSQTALEGGALGWRKGPEIPTVLADLVVGLKPGEVSEPLRTPSGYHIVRLNEVRGNDQQVVIRQTRARHILLKPTEIQDDATVRQRLLDARERILKGEDFAVLAKTLSEDPGSAAEGGDLGWSAPGNFVPEFDRMLESLTENEISQPFRTQFGWHVVQLLGRRDYDNTEELRRQRAFLQLRESKADEETELWLRRLRDEAYVDIKS